MSILYYTGRFCTTIPVVAVAVGHPQHSLTTTQQNSYSLCHLLGTVTTQCTVTTHQLCRHHQQCSCHQLCSRHAADTVIKGDYTVIVQSVQTEGIGVIICTPVYSTHSSSVLQPIRGIWICTLNVLCFNGCSCRL